jgi:uncharacterized membrane protein YecN with MAPEG domain
MVITVYAAFLGFWYIFLILQVIRVRMGIKGKLQGGQQSKDLANAVKAHATFSEYIPLPLILLVLLEMQEANLLYLNFLAALLCLSRVLHSVSLLFIEKLLKTTKLRMLATALTILVVLLAAFSNLFMYFTRGDNIIESL